MKPYWQNEQHGLSIYLGDCLEVMPQLGREFDLCLTDPPYGVDDYEAPLWHRENRGKTAAHQEWEHWDECDYRWWECAGHCLGRHGAALVFCMIEQAGDNARAARAAKLNTRGNIIWANTTPIPRGCRPVYQSAAQAIVWAGRAGCVFNRPPDGRGRWNVIQGPNTRSNTERVGHPTQKPKWLIELLMERHSTEGQRVLDPFLGSGTTLVACYRLGRQGVGVEIDERYCQLAAERLEREIAQGRLFEPGETAPKPVQATLEVE